MSTYTRRKHSPQGQNSIAGKRHGCVYTQAQHGVVRGRRADGVDRPFPNKPVSHRRPLNSSTQVSPDLYDFEKITITKQPRDPLSLQDHSSGITGSQQHTRKDPHGFHRGELQMAREIHAKELKLQKKLCRVEEKIRQRIQEDSVDTAAGDDQKSEEERLNRGQTERGKTQTKTRLSERQRSESVRSREIMQEIRQEDVKQLRKRQDQRTEHRMRNIHEEERARWKGREFEVAHSPQLQRKGWNGTHKVIVHGQEVSGDLNKLRWKNVKEHTKRKGEGEEDNCMWGEIGVNAKEREQNTTSVGEKDWIREKKFRERTYKEMYSADDERDMPQMSQQKTSHRAATENHTGAGIKQSVEPLLPPVSSSSHCSRPEQGEDRPIDNTYDGLQLLPCRICNRKFVSKRLEVHVQICAKVKQSHRRVFNPRVKGTNAEEYWKSHSRHKAPEKKKKLNQKANTRDLHKGQRSAGTSQPRQSK